MSCSSPSAGRDTKTRVGGRSSFSRRLSRVFMKTFYYTPKNGNSKETQQENRQGKWERDRGLLLPFQKYTGDTKMDILSSRKQGICEKDTFTGHANVEDRKSISPLFDIHSSTTPTGVDEDKLIPSYQKMSRSSSSVSQRVDSPVSPSVDFLTPCVVTFHDVRFGPNFGTRDFVADEFFDLRAVVSVRNKGCILQPSKYTSGSMLRPSEYLEVYINKLSILDIDVHSISRQRMPREFNHSDIWLNKENDCSPHTPLCFDKMDSKELRVLSSASRLGVVSIAIEDLFYEVNSLRLYHTWFPLDQSQLVGGRQSCQSPILEECRHWNRLSGIPSDQSLCSNVSHVSFASPESDELDEIPMASLSLIPSVEWTKSNLYEGVAEPEFCKAAWKSLLYSHTQHLHICRDLYNKLNAVTFQLRQCHEKLR